MSISHRRLLASLSALAVVAVSCGGSSARTVTLTATSSSDDQVEVSYELDGAVVTETVDAPWSQAVEVSGEFDLSLVVTNPSNAGDVGCAVDGLGIGPPIAATGEAAASCEASGLISSSSSSITSSASGTPRTGGDANTANTDDATADVSDVADDAAEAAGIVAELVIVDTSGQPSELTQFRSFGASLRVSGLDVSGDESIIVDGALVYQSPTVTGDASASELYGADDVVDGMIEHRLSDRDFIVVTDPGIHTLTATGTVSLPDRSIEVPFDLTVDVDVAAVEIELVTTEFLDGAVILDIPSDYNVTNPQEWTFTTEDGLGVEAPAEPALFETLVFVGSPGGSAAASVLRSTRPLANPDLEVAAQQLNELLPLPGTITPSQFGGVPSVRIESADDETFRTLDLIRIGDEFLAIEAGGSPSNQQRLAEVAAIAESAVFDTDAFPRLSHSTVITTSDQNSNELGSYRVPANWVQDGPVISSSDALVGARLGFVAGDQSLDSVVAQVVDDAGYVGPGEPAQLDGVDFISFFVADDIGVRRDFVGSVPGGVLVFTVYDERPDVDLSLVDAIVASFTVVAR